jgi:membrane-bound lytic murein transglycosylase D
LKGRLVRCAREIDKEGGMYSKTIDDRSLRRLIRGAALLLSAVFLTAGWGLDDGDDVVNDSGWLSEEVVPVLLADIERELTSAQLPLHENERVEFWTRRFVTEEKQAFEDLLSRAGLYSGMITAKLRERGMPEELIHLAMIESGFVTDARSYVSALGVWQFMSPTALAYGLRIDSYVDERRDPVRATDAALDYLEELYQRYGSWYLAAAAYNAGPTRVSRALNRHAGGRVGDESLYWEIVDHLPPETAQYVPKLVAATYLARYASKYGFEVTRAEPYAYDVVWTPGGTGLEAVGKSVGVSTARMYELNPQLIMSMTPPGAAYALRVPVGSGPQVVAALGMPDRRIRRAD